MYVDEMKLLFMKIIIIHSQEYMQNFESACKTWSNNMTYLTVYANKMVRGKSSIRFNI